ncbi:MAG TPA: hypothetical protein ENI73_10715 [Spirochaetes bacterium]|nr:hypothetical protein [Spirochaetota bacterium]
MMINSIILFIIILLGIGFVLPIILRKNRGKIKSQALSAEERQKIILQIAKKNMGRVTPIDVAAESPIAIKEVEKILKDWSSNGYAEMKVSDSGMIVYQISFMDVDEKLN